MAVAAGFITFAAAGSAQAVSIDFETADTSQTNLPFLLHGDTVTEGGYYFQARDISNSEGAFVGVMGNGSDPEACLDGQCPAGNLTNYMVGLNDGFIKFGRLDGGKSNLLSFDAAFVAGATTLPMAIPAILGIQAYYANGDVFEIDYYMGAVGPGGATSFHSYTANFAAGADSFAAFVYRCGSDGLCSAFDTNEGQFAFDNVVLENVGPGAAVPEPATWAMMLGGFGMVGAAARYRARKSKLVFA